MFYVLKALLFTASATGFIILSDADAANVTLLVVAGVFISSALDALTERARMNRIFNQELNRRADITRGKMVEMNQPELLRDFEYGVRVLRGTTL